MSDIVIIISLLFFFTMIWSLYFILSKKHKSSSNENFNNYETFREKDNTQKIPLKENEWGIKKEISNLKQLLFFILFIIIISLFYVKFWIKRWITITIGMIIYGIIKEPYLMKNIKNNNIDKTFNSNNKKL